MPNDGRENSERKIYLIAEVIEVEDNQVYNTAILIDPAGNLRGKHRKITSCGSNFLERYRTPGTDLSTFDTQWGKVGIMICSDRNLSEIPKILSPQGVEIVFGPSCGIMMNSKS